MYTSVHHSTAHNSPKIFILNEKEKNIAVSLYNGMLFHKENNYFYVHKYRYISLNYI